jgi:hypothetical protein
MDVNQTSQNDQSVYIVSMLKDYDNMESLKLYLQHVNLSEETCNEVFKIIDNTKYPGLDAAILYYFMRYVNRTFGKSNVLLELKEKITDLERRLNTKDDHHVDYKTKYEQDEKVFNNFLELHSNVIPPHALKQLLESVNFTITGDAIACISNDITIDNISYKNPISVLNNLINLVDSKVSLQVLTEYAKNNNFTMYKEFANYFISHVEYYLCEFRVIQYVTEFFDNAGYTTFERDFELALANHLLAKHKSE